MTLHRLKTWPESFADVVGRRKRYEIRVDDRAFAVGDALLLREWRKDPYVSGGTYTGEACLVTVVHKTAGGNWGLPENLCVLGIQLEEVPYAAMRAIIESEGGS